MQLFWNCQVAMAVQGYCSAAVMLVAWLQLRYPLVATQLAGGGWWLERIL
jgi:hypothetical protein